VSGPLGTVATNTSGPRRLLHGTMRDLLIGITFVRADGVVAKAGGTVVKNVAGYDFGNLLTGSYGTLGVITEVALRLHPLPRARQAVSVRTADGAADAEAALRVVRSLPVPRG
jgi:glycolate oxidase FAD binding subunit